MSHSIAIFVDVQNIYYTTRDTFGQQFDYRSCWAQLAQRGQIAHAIAYATDRGDSQQRGFQKALRHIGFEVKLKPYIQRSDGSAKGDWDVGITVDIMRLAASVDEIILLSGDGDFAVLLDHLRDQKICQTTVLGVPALTADALITSCDRFVAIDKSMLLA